MQLSHFIQIDVPPKFALIKTWQMHFQNNLYTQNTFIETQSPNSFKRQVELLDGRTVKQRVILNETNSVIQYENIAGLAKGKIIMNFQHIINSPNKTKLTTITYSKTEKGQFFPSKEQLIQGLNNSKTILQARYRVQQQMPKCCQCKLFG